MLAAEVVTGLWFGWLARLFALAWLMLLTGAVLLAAPLKVHAGSGSPLRVLALITGDEA